jgi:hypothetical protein
MERVGRVNVTGNRARDPRPAVEEVEEFVEIGSSRDDDTVIELRQESGTRRVLAIIYSLGMTIALIMVIFGGLIHAFDATLIDVVCVAYGGASGSVAIFYFRQRGGKP